MRFMLVGCACAAILNALATEVETDIAVMAIMLRRDATQADTETAIIAANGMILNATTLYMQRFPDHRDAMGDLIDAAAGETLT